jgi:hypothetical protein
MITKTKTECETKLCYYESATRTRFYNGMLLTDEHLRDEQNYHREARKRLNRYLWGSGIVCGLKVEKGKTNEMCLKVHPGVALDCCGNLIEVCKCITLDLSKECEKKFGPDCEPPLTGATDFEIKKYLVLRYMEIPTDSAPVLTPDADCQPAGEGKKCEASKVREGFCIELWDNCPCPDPCEDADASLLTQWIQSGEIVLPRAIGPGVPTPPRPLHGPPSYEPNEPNCMDLVPPCQDCGCCESAVALAYLNIHCAKNEVEVTCDCRYEVLSARWLKWYLCLHKSPKPAGTQTRQARQAQQKKQTQMEYLHSRLGEGPTANLVARDIEFQRMSNQIKELQNTVARLTGQEKTVVQLTKRVDKLYQKKPPAAPKPPAAAAPKPPPVPKP